MQNKLKNRKRIHDLKAWKRRIQTWSWLMRGGIQYSTEGKGNICWNVWAASSKISKRGCCR